MIGDNERWYQEVLHDEVEHALDAETVGGEVDLIGSARKAFKAEYEQWTRNYPEHWVAYHGGQAVCIGLTRENVYWRALQALYDQDEIFVAHIAKKKSATLRLADTPDKSAA